MTWYNQFVMSRPLSMQLFQMQEIDLDSLMCFNDEDLKRVGLK